MQFIKCDGYEGHPEGIPVWGEPDPGAVEQIKRCVKDKRVAYAALMADHHKGYAVPIGGVLAYREAISPSGVGYDIGCGNKAVRLDADANEVRKNIKTIMDDVWKQISFGVGRVNNEEVDSDFFDDDSVWKLKAIAPLKEMARKQLGTVGSGNHYVDIFTDEEDRVWVGVHFGSRGLGHKIATWALKEAGGTDGMDVDPVVIDINTELGVDYFRAMELAGDYAYAGRDWVCQKVANIIGAKIEYAVHNHHNYAWLEYGPSGELLWVVRKGATPAHYFQQGFVGGTMGECSVILEGTKDADVMNMRSTVHGAGRVIGRMAAKGKYKNGVCVREPQVDALDFYRQMQMAQVELRGGGLDEAPVCYKRLPEVLAAHGNSIKVMHTLTPIGVAMADFNALDPYKD